MSFAGRFTFTQITQDLWPYQWVEWVRTTDDYCDMCGESIPLMYPETFYCMSCETRVRRELVLDKIDFGQAVEWQFRQDLAEFLAYDVRRRRQLHYLWNSLLARRSPFRKFTYLFNGIPGSISAIEDVIDRILGFLKTVSSRAIAQKFFL